MTRAGVRIIEYLLTHNTKTLEFTHYYYFNIVDINRYCSLLLVTMFIICEMFQSEGMNAFFLELFSMFVQ